MVNHPNRMSKRLFSFSAPVFADETSLDQEIGRATTADEALQVYKDYYRLTGRLVGRARKLKRMPGVVGPEYGWIPVFEVG